MIRILLLHIVLFLLPFLFYAAWISLWQKKEISTDYTPKTLMELCVVGLVIVSISLVFFARFSGYERDMRYEPPRFEDGTFDPGGYKPPS